MAKLANTAARVFDRLNEYLAILTQILVAYMVISITIQVITRYVFNFVPALLMETWQYSLMVIPFLGAAWLLRMEGHVVVDVLFHFMKPRAQAILNAVTSGITAAATLGFGIFAALMVIETYQAGHRDPESILFLPSWIIISVIPFGMALLFIQFSRRTYRYWRSGEGMETRAEKAMREQAMREQAA